jgi:hypothetical protein
LKVKARFQVRLVMNLKKILFCFVYREAFHTSHRQLAFLADEIGDPKKGVKIAKL